MTSKISDAAGDDRSAAAARLLLSAQAVRDTARRLLGVALEGGLEDWEVDLDRLPPTAEFVAALVRERYPDLRVPVHSRWRHFVFDGRDLWRELAARGDWPDAAATARSAFDLAITSVLLDAGAGPRWQFHDPVSGMTRKRSEGLALASLRWFQNGGLSSVAKDPWRVDAAALESLDGPALQRAFQADADNPLVGLPGRAALLNRLGREMERRPDLFALEDSPRPGGLFDALRARVEDGQLRAATLLAILLEALGPIWEGRPSLGGVPLGDCWYHPALAGIRPEDGLVPLHKLSQWLAYSLIEPLAAAGVAVTGLDQLTGLAEYRNGGLMIDLGILRARRRDALLLSYDVADPFVVGWRSLTVALLDRLAPLVAAQLGLTVKQFPLACMLEGGTWAAGRRTALEKRDHGGPPFQVLSDGTVF